MLKNILLLTFLFLVINASVVYWLLGENDQENFKPTPLIISQVTIYPQQARLSATQALSLKPGDTTLVFSNIAPKIDTNSLQINPSGELTIQKMYYRLRPLNDKNQESQQKTLQDTLTIYEDSIAQTNIMVLALQKEEDMLLANQTLTTAQEALTADKLKEMSGFIKNRFIDIQKEKIKLNKQIQTLTASQEKIKQRWEKIKQNPQQMSSEIVVHLSSPNVYNGSLEISYLVNDCGWQPVYEVKINTDTLAQLTFKAQIWQNSGLAWQNVKLTISQNQPQTSKNRLNLRPRQADLASEPDSTQPNQTDTLAQQAEAQNLDISGETLEVEQPEWTLEKNLSLASNVYKQNIVVKNVDFKPEWAYAAFPQVAPQVYQAILWRGWQSAKLPLGTAKVYQQGKLKQALELLTTMDTILQIPLQAVAKVEMKRNLLKKTQTSDNQTVTEQWQYEIRLNNPQKDTLDLYINEVLPKVKNEKIKLTWQANNQAKLNKNMQILQWQIRLLPQSNQILQYEYSLAYPEKKKLLWQ
ncbi:MAG: DUF4139 domain-containing protein [Microscillaceae bacterium]|jgi:uncharacterized protein (TIGR02231 family)|nr:DUF4139 domain-containing protein [Microscillaceae bacterium]